MAEASVDFNTLLALGFGLWAGVIAWIGKGILRRLDDTGAALQQYIVQTEARLAVLEDRLEIS